MRRSSRASITWTMARLVVPACLANVALNLVLLPRCGILGAVRATLGSYTLLLLMTAKACHRALPLEIRWAACAGYLAAVAAGVAAALPIRIQQPVLNLTARGTVVPVAYGVVPRFFNSRACAFQGVRQAGPGGFVPLTAVPASACVSASFWS